ncbi:MAG TPA: hypothetical protein VMV81_11430, partial [Phycisphaerae bacterium]|nr:hypothetical protein [Phycisphaerae bacterium]
MTEERYFPPDSRQDAEVQLKLTPERLESIARSWPVEEANARYRALRAQTLVSETVIDMIGNEKVTAPDVLALA